MPTTTAKNCCFCYRVSVLIDSPLSGDVVFLEKLCSRLFSFAQLGNPTSFVNTSHQGSKVERGLVSKAKYMVLERLINERGYVLAFGMVCKKLGEE